MKLKQREGISLIVLVITIVIMLILAGTIIASMRVSNDNALLSRFVNDLAQLEEYSRTMYIMDNKLPVVDEEQKMTKTQLLSLVKEENKSAFTAELSLNSESNDSVYYQLDLKKAGAGDVEQGMGKDGTDDIYVISSHTLKVYYLEGVDYEDEMYFSINSKLVNIVSLPETYTDSSQLTITFPEAEANPTSIEDEEVIPTLQIGNVQEYEEFNIVNGVATGKNIEVRYDYKINDGVEYDLTQDYMKTKSKSVSVGSSGEFSIKIPKTVTTVTVAAISKSGNIVMKDVNI